jgi:hypothetical protein
MFIMLFSIIFGINLEFSNTTLKDLLYFHKIPLFWNFFWKTEKSHVSVFDFQGASGV